MTIPQFREILEQLGCEEDGIGYLTRLVVGLMGQYRWLERDDVLAIALESVPYAVRTYDSSVVSDNGKTAKLSSWLVTVARSKLLSYLKQETRAREGKSYGALAETEAGSATYEMVCHVDSDDLMGKLSSVLSPMAWRVLREGLKSSPVRVSTRAMAQKMGMTGKGVNLLKEEIRQALKFLRPE